MTPETLDRLEAQAAQQIGREMGTPVAVNPGDLRALITCYRKHNTDVPSVSGAAVSE